MKTSYSFSITCLAKTLIAPATYELRCTKPQHFSFKPGQFVLFSVPLPENKRDVQPRAYSIASSPEEKDLRFVIKLVPNGRASRWIEECLIVGTTIAIQGPFGVFTLPASSDNPYCFIATGTGVAPMRSHILWLLQTQKAANPIRLLFGALKKGDLFWEEEWKELESRYSNFRASASFLSGESDWHNVSGALQERIPNLLRELVSPGVYLCGAPATVQELKDLCMQCDIPKTNIHAENYV